MANKDANAGLMLAVGAMAESAKVYCDKMISLDDHTLQELAEMGHPYARRDPQPIHDPIEQVHEQTGALRAGLEATRPIAKWGYIEAWVVNNCQPLDNYIQVGTRFMIARPYMQAVRRLYHEQIEALGVAVFTRFFGRKWAA